MNKLIMTILIFLNALNCFAVESKLGLDYLKITKNKLLAETVLEIEPKLIEHYQKSEYACLSWYVKDSVKGIASNFGKDTPRKSLMKTLRKVDPDIPLKFLKLDKIKYPNLWNYGELIRLRKEKEKSLWLYKSLHGDDYSEK